MLCVYTKFEANKACASERSENADGKREIVYIWKISKSTFFVASGVTPHCCNFVAARLQCVDVRARYMGTFCGLCAHGALSLHSPFNSIQMPCCRPRTSSHIIMASMFHIDRSAWQEREKKKNKIELQEFRPDGHDGESASSVSSKKKISLSSPSLVHRYFCVFPSIRT